MRQDPTVSIFSKLKYSPDASLRIDQFNTFSTNDIGRYRLSAPINYQIGSR